MAFDRPPGVGASGGHGPIRYAVEAYTPGRSIPFRFTGPAGFDGWHGFEVIRRDALATVRLLRWLVTGGKARSQTARAEPGLGSGEQIS